MKQRIDNDKANVLGNIPLEFYGSILFDGVKEMTLSAIDVVLRHLPAEKSSLASCAKKIWFLVLDHDQAFAADIIPVIA